MTNLDLLLLKGANRDLTEENLAELRYTVLTKGIPANSEGMVNNTHLPRPLLHTHAVRLTQRAPHHPPNPISSSQKRKR